MSGFVQKQYNSVLLLHFINRKNLILYLIMILINQKINLVLIIIIYKKFVIQLMSYKIKNFNWTCQKQINKVHQNYCKKKNL